MRRGMRSFIASFFSPAQAQPGLARGGTLTSLAESFVGLDHADIDLGLDEALARLGSMNSLERASILQFHADGERFSATHEWADEGVPGLKARCGDLALPLLGQAGPALLAGEAWLGAPESSSQFWTQRCAGLLAWPLRYKGVSLGFLLFERGASRAWQPREIDDARQAAGLLAQLLARQRGEKSLRLAEARLRDELKERSLKDSEHERLLANLLAVFNAGRQAIVLISRDGKVEAFNHNAARLLKGARGRELAAGLPAAEFLPQGLEADFNEAFARCLKGDEARCNALDWHLEALPVFSEGGEVRSVCSSFEPPAPPAPSFPIS